MEFMLNLLCIFEHEKLLLQLELNCTVSELTTNLLPLHILELVEIATQSRIKVWVDLILLGRISQFAI